jgi:hypothetical protein
LGIVMLIAAPLFARYSPEKFSPHAIEIKLFEHQCQRSYPKYGFDLARFDELSSREQNVK